MAYIYSKEYQCVITALKKARKERGSTQVRLAEALGRPQSFIAKIERRLVVVEFVHLARLVGLEPEEIVKGIG
ncbi:helix-turn-helix domain-containing protein [Kosakonia pseudosacchari]|uniref:helix-turn-helix domain-containing protein n=1 Tax=Kosakonia pseudosacchari TaxID=1646340 RepID=UPI000A36EA6F|nr:helix-turn-helix domain-containing protein [Kosakonia pseudosacchari]